MSDNDTNAAVREAMEKAARDFEDFGKTTMTGERVAARLRAAAKTYDHAPFAYSDSEDRARLEAIANGEADHAPAREACRGGDEIGLDWASALVLHSGDKDWHAWSLSAPSPRA